MIITPAEAAHLLTANGNLLKDEEVNQQCAIDAFVEELVNPIQPMLTGGRGHKIPPIFREIIAIQTNTGVSISDASKSYGISERHTHELKGGNVHRVDQRNSGGLRDSDIALAQALEKSLGKVRDKALEKIYKSMDSIQDESLENEQPKVLSTIAANLSRVVSSTMRNDKNQQTLNVQTVFYSPNKQPVEAYDVIDVG